VELAPGPLKSARGEALEAVRRADSRRPARVRVERAEPPTSLRSGLHDAFPWFRTPRGKLALWVAGLAVGSGAGATVLREQIRGWLDVPSTTELRAIDDRHASAAASNAARITELEQRDKARAEREQRAREAEDRRVHSEQIRALQDELRRAYRSHPGRPPVVMPPAEP